MIGQVLLYAVFAEGLADDVFELGDTGEAFDYPVAFGRDGPVVDQREQRGIGDDDAIRFYMELVAGGFEFAG